MPDPGKRTEHDLRKRRSSGFEPVDQRIWELPDQGPEERPRKHNMTNRYIASGILALIVLVLLVAMWLL